MSPARIPFVICLLIGGLLLSGQAALVPEATPSDHETVPRLATQQSPDSPQWTTWGANQYALADDGVYIWIGATGGVVRWNKQQHTYHRYSAVDGLPHTAVLAVAVDGAGNRWFGGDRGLSRLDAKQRWTHFRAVDSGLHSDQVVGIAVGGSDTLYLSHGLPGGSVSRRDSDGAWRWFPNRETAVQADYGTVVQTRAATPLWTVVGNEVWVGWEVFDGERWTERKPVDVTDEPVSLAADSRNHVWALSGATVYEWDGGAWLTHFIRVSFTGKITALAVDDDRVWIGLQERGSNPYTSETAVVRELSGTPSSSFRVSGPVAALLATPDGVWGIGPGWLMLPDLTASVLADGPRFKNLPDALLGGDGSVWLYSGYSEPYSTGAVQTLDDKGTLALEDDTWQVRPADYRPYLGYCEVVSAFERVANDSWYTSYCAWRGWYDFNAVRYTDLERTEHPLNARITDIFAQDQHHIWFASSSYDGSGNVLSLDDGGTPADTGDDVWRTFPFEADDGEPVVAVDALGRLWLGRASGLYRHDGSTWQLIDGDYPVCDLAPAADGTLYAQIGPYHTRECAKHSDALLVVRADGRIEDSIFSTKRLIEAEPATVASARRRNSLWTIASDGAIWYVSHQDPGQELQRRSGSGLLTYALPVESDAVRRLEVDARGHVWLVADSQLWRMAGPPPLPPSQYLPMVAR